MKPAMTASFTTISHKSNPVEEATFKTIKRKRLESCLNFPVTKLLNAEKLDLFQAIKFVAINLLD